MRHNPYSEEEPSSAQPTEVMPSSGRMADLPSKQVQLPHHIVSEDGAEVESAETLQEEALTVRYAIGKLNDFLRWFVVVMVVTLAIRFLLKLIGADPTTLFAGFLFALTDIILFPFSNIVHSTPIFRSPQNVFEWSSLVAMGIYWLIFWALRRFLKILISTPEEPAT